MVRIILWRKFCWERNYKRIKLIIQLYKIKERKYECMKTLIYLALSVPIQTYILSQYNTVKEKITIIILIIILQILAIWL